jgi:hypothetical protein
VPGSATVGLTIDASRIFNHHCAQRRFIMSAELSSQTMASGQDSGAVQIDGELRCALTGRPLRPDEAYWAPPLVTTRQLIATVWHTLTTAPGNLGGVLMSEEPNVPYAPEARPDLARRRSAEQMKLMALLLIIAAALIIPIVMLIS